MKTAGRPWLGGLLASVLAFLFISTSTLAAPAASSATNDSRAVQLLTWRKNKTADARIEKMPLAKLLARLSAASGWRIYLQPGLTENVSAQFQNASQGDALKLLLGNLNYAFVPQRGGGARLYVYKTAMSDATSLVAPDRAGRPKNWLANEMIVSLAPGSAQDMEKLAAELGGKVVAKSEALNAYRLEFPDAATAEAAREKVAAREDLAFHDNYSFDRPASAGGGSPSPEALFPIDSKPVARGAQVTVALVDTAIQPLEGKMKDFVLDPVHMRDQPAALPEEPTHATSMAQTILNSMAFTKNSGSANGESNLGNVRVLPIDIYGSGSSTTTFEVAQGLHQAIQSGAQVINLSLGGGGESPMVDYLLEMAHKKEILVFASAGNSPTTDFTFPAANPNAIAVTAADGQGNIAPYANRGTFVDVKAPGSSKIYYNGLTYLSTGTSTATAYVSGQAAALTARGYSATETAHSILKNFDVNAAALQGGSRK